MSQSVSSSVFFYFIKLYHDFYSQTWNLLYKAEHFFPEISSFLGDNLTQKWPF